MSYIIVFKEQAKENIAIATQWYENRRVGLGNKLLKELNKAIEQLHKNPNIYQIRRKNIRLALLQQFPYLMVYEIIEKQVIIYNVLHTHRHPKKRQSNPSRQK